MTAALLFAVLGEDDAGCRDVSAHPRRATALRKTPSRPTTFQLPPDIAARIRARDQSALRTMMDVALEPLVRFAYSFVHSYDAAEDVVQDVFVRVWAQGERWEPGESVVVYLYGAVRNRALNSIRSRASDQRLTERIRSESETVEWSSLAPSWASPEHMAHWHELMAAFDAAVATLTERQRSAVLLRFEQGCTVPEIASVLDLSLKAAEKLVSRGVRELRARLEAVLR